MRKSFWVTLLCVALVGGFMLSNLFAAGPAAPKGVQELKLPGTLTKAPVKFSHDNHKDDCKVCHHKWDGKGAIKKCHDAGCHDDMKAKKGEKSAYMAFHDMKAKASCIGCHKAKAKGPTKCAECHPGAKE